jgi:hypothetical protein
MGSGISSITSFAALKRLCLAEMDRDLFDLMLNPLTRGMMLRI